jgi:hypothetical protein
MRYKLLGQRTGLRVSELSLGTGMFGTGWGYGADPAEARRTFDRFLEAGGNFFDTADGYQFGQSESLLGDFASAHRDELVIATKYSGGAAKQPTLAKTGNSRKNMLYSVEQSLKRLKTDRIDLLWVHHSDNVTPMEEILRGLDDLVSIPRRRARSLAGYGQNCAYRENCPRNGYCGRRTGSCKSHRQNFDRSCPRMAAGKVASVFDLACADHWTSDASTAGRQFKCNRNHSIRRSTGEP